MTSTKQSEQDQKHGAEKMPERGTAAAAPREQSTPEKSRGQGTGSEGDEPISKQNCNSSKV
jgi:hypothetical protein